ncbi:MAG TPA: heparinase II/III family protein [Bryobacteraceae bacterium]|jgi:hypothetical protein
MRLLLASSLVLTALAAPQPKPLLEPFRLFDDFTANNLSQWTSYPPAQDAGYDPSLTPTSEYGAPGGRSLMRFVRPPSTGRTRFGFLKRLDLASDGVVSLSFSYRFLPAIPVAIEVGLAGGDGRRYRRLLQSSTNNWTEARVEFREMPAGVAIQALYITATLEHGDPDVDCRFLLDNVKLDAARPAAFQVDVPRTQIIAPWPAQVSASTYAPGETIELAAKAPVELTQASCILKDVDGRSVVTAPLKLDKGRWINPALYTIAGADPKGVWRAELHGTTRDGRTITTDVRLLVRTSRADLHPRLYFGRDDHAALAARSRDPRFADLWNRIVDFSRKSRDTGDLTIAPRIFPLLDSRYLLPSLPGYFDILNRGSDRLLYNALAGYVSGDEASRTTAKSALLQISSWPAWAPPWFAAHGQSTYYPAGELTTVVALAYDLLYDELSDSQRNLVRQALIDRGIKPAFDEYVADNRISASTSNWIGHAVGGAIVATLAVLPREDDPKLSLWLGGLLLKFEDHLDASYLPDGSYGEGISYQEFDLKSTTLALYALEHSLGVDYWKRSYVRDSLQYPLYTLAEPRHSSPDMGDSHPPAGSNIAGIIQHSRDPILHWYYDRFEHRSIEDFLFPPEPLAPAPPTAPVSRIFDRKGDAVFRTGWAPDDAILLFRAGPNFNHNHADQGSFLLRNFGEDLAVEAGYSDYYKDPYYATYFSQASGHNTILVNGDSASQEVADTAQFPALNAYPRITDSITTDFFDAVGSELSSVYKGVLKSYSRRIAFLKPGYVVVSDELETGGSPAKFDWLLHVRDRNRLHETTGGAMYEGTHASMSVRLMEPARSATRITGGHLPFAVFNPTAPAAAPEEPGILDFTADAPTGSGRYLVLLAMASSAHTAGEMAARAKIVSGENCTGIQIDSGEVFIRRLRGPSARCGEWTTDARQWTSAGPILSAERVTSLRKNTTAMFQSDRPVDFAARYGDGTITLTVSADQDTTIGIHSDSTAQMLRMPVRAGKTNVVLHR